MGQSRATVSGSTVTAITLGVVGLLMVLLLFPAAKVVGALLGVAAIIVGGFSAANARRAGGSWVAPVVGVGAGVVAVVVLVALIPSLA